MVSMNSTPACKSAEEKYLASFNNGYKDIAAKGEVPPKEIRDPVVSAAEEYIDQCFLTKPGDARIPPLSVNYFKEERLKDYNRGNPDSTGKNSTADCRKTDISTVNYPECTATR